jgi:hypothetical protein
MILILEQAHPFALGRGYLHDSDLARNLLGVVVNERLPENASPDREPNNGEKSAIAMTYPLILFEKRLGEARSRVAVEARHFHTTQQTATSRTARRFFWIRAGWSNIIPRKGSFQSSGDFRLDAYSEYMPPPCVG